MDLFLGEGHVFSAFSPAMGEPHAIQKLSVDKPLDIELWRS